MKKWMMKYNILPPLMKFKELNNLANVFLNNKVLNKHGYFYICSIKINLNY